MGAYCIRITTIDNLYVDYIVEADSLLKAKVKAMAAFFRDYPGANLKIKASIEQPSHKIITEIIEIIRGVN